MAGKLWQAAGCGGAGFIGGVHTTKLMQDDPWTQDELDELMNEWNDRLRTRPTHGDGE